MCHTHTKPVHKFPVVLTIVISLMVPKAKLKPLSMDEKEPTIISG
jgi:hypothetical protein